jgi:hypothetical protein
MTERDDREQQQADLLWRYIEELRQAENPEEVQFVAVTRGECAEVAGLMATAAETGALLRTEVAPNCRREAARQRLREALANTVPEASPTAAAGPRSRERLAGPPSWLRAPLMARSTGWAVAVIVLVAVLWSGTFRGVHKPPVPAQALSHAETLEVMPKLVAGTLDPDMTRAAWGHLNRCKDCLDLYRLKWRSAHSQPQRASEPWPARPSAVWATLALPNPGISAARFPPSRP